MRIPALRESESELGDRDEVLDGKWRGNWTLTLLVMVVFFLCGDRYWCNWTAGLAVDTPAVPLLFLWEWTVSREGEVVLLHPMLALIAALSFRHSSSALAYTLAAYALAVEISFFCCITFFSFLRVAAKRPFCSAAVAFASLPDLCLAIIYILVGAQAPVQNKWRLGGAKIRALWSLARRSSLSAPTSSKVDGVVVEAAVDMLGVIEPHFCRALGTSTSRKRGMVFRARDESLHQMCFWEQVLRAMEAVLWLLCVWWSMVVKFGQPVLIRIGRLRNGESTNGAHSPTHCWCWGSESAQTKRIQQAAILAMVNIVYRVTTSMDLTGVFHTWFLRRKCKSCVELFVVSSKGPQEPRCFLPTRNCILKSNNPKNPNELMIIPIAHASTVVPEPPFLHQHPLLHPFLQEQPFAFLTGLAIPNTLRRRFLV